MLDPRFEGFYFLFSFIGHEEGVSIEYDRGSLYLMLLKCSHYLHLVAKFEIRCANQTTNANSYMDIFLTNSLHNLKQTNNKTCHH